MGKGTGEVGRGALLAPARSVERLYHYTSRQALARILRDCTLRPSAAPWGFGVFLTDLAPDALGRRELSDALFGPGRFASQWQRLEAYVGMPREKADADPDPRSAHVFRAPGKVSIAGEDIEVGFWLGALDDPDDTSGWSRQSVVHCAPDLEKLQRLFEGITG